METAREGTTEAEGEEETIKEEPNPIEAMRGTRVMEIKEDAGTTATREEVIKTTSKQTPITEEAAIKTKMEAEADINRMSDVELNVSDAENLGITPPKIALCQIPI